MKTPLTLAPNDVILAAWVECASGPGWANKLLHVLVQSSTDGLRLECVQGADFSENLHVLSRVSDATNAVMVAAARGLVKIRRKA